jgi:uroporphyrinogen-III synthase
MSILITRPKKQAQYIAKAIKNSGGEYVVDSIIEIIVNNKIPDLNLDIFSHFVITSANCIPYIAKLKLDKNKIFFTVGDKSAQEIAKLGFKNIINAKNSAILLRNLMIKKLDKNHNKVLYFRGDVISYDLEEFFKNKGFNFSSITAYKTLESSNLQKNTIEKIKNGEIKKILIYSLRSAKIFYKLVKKHQILNITINIEISCISNKVADFFIKKGFLQINTLYIN